jgi:hypothetical protein
MNTTKPATITLDIDIVTTEHKLVDVLIVCQKCGNDTSTLDNGGIYIDRYESIVDYGICTVGIDGAMDTDGQYVEHIGDDLTTDYRCGQCGESLIVEKEQP